MWRLSAQLAQWAAPEVRTALRRPIPPLENGRQAISVLSGWRRHGGPQNLRCRSGAPPSRCSWVEQRRSTAVRSMHTGDRVSRRFDINRSCFAETVTNLARTNCSCPSGVPNIVIPWSSGGRVVSPRQTTASGSDLRAAVNACAPVGTLPARFHNCVLLVNPDAHARAVLGWW